MKNFVKIIMGSEKDFEFCKKIAEVLEKFTISYHYRVRSAHKKPEMVECFQKENRERFLKADKEVSRYGKC